MASSLLDRVTMPNIWPWKRPQSNNYNNLTDDNKVETFTDYGTSHFTDDSHEYTFTLQQALDQIGFGFYQLKVVLLTGFIWAADSMEVMILSILSPALHCVWKLSPLKQAILSVVVFSGMFVSSGLWGSASDKYGRRSILLLSSAITVYFGFLSSFSPTYIWMLVLRGMVGVGVGGSNQAITYASEFLPTSVRAKSMATLEVFWTTGAVVQVVIALIIMPSLGWRYLLAISAVPLFLILICCTLARESPRYDLTNGNAARSLRTLQKIATTNSSKLPQGNLHDPTVNETVEHGRLVDLFTPDMRLTTCLLWFIWLSLGFAYYGLILLTTSLFEYGSSCYSDANQHLRNPACFIDCQELTTTDYVNVLWTSLAEIPGLVVTGLLVDKVGRKKIIIFEFIGFAFVILLINICVERALLTILLVISRAFIAGVFQAVVIYTPEVYPTNNRALGIGVCTSVSRVGAICTPFIAQVIVRSSPHFAVSVYGVAAILSAVAAYFLPYETTGVELRDVGTSKIN